MNGKTLTESQAEAGLIVIYRGANTAHLSSAREIPYVEIYRQSTGLIETPIERIQKAAQDEARRSEIDSPQYRIH